VIKKKTNQSRRCNLSVMSQRNSMQISVRRQFVISNAIVGCIFNSVGLIIASGNIMSKYNAKHVMMYKVIINDCPIVGVEYPHKFWMCRYPRNVRQTSGQISTTAGSATYRRYKCHSCYEAWGTFNYVTHAYCDETIIYNDPVQPDQQKFRRWILLNTRWP
jgi:hypothetical protein